MNESDALFAFIGSLPLGAIALWAWTTTKPNPHRMHILFIHNAAAGIGTLLGLFILLIASVSYVIRDNFGGCNSGFFGPSTCDNIPNQLGDALFGIFFLGGLHSVFIAPPAALLYIGAEIVTRVREEKARANA